MPVDAQLPLHHKYRIYHQTAAEKRPCRPDQRGTRGILMVLHGGNGLEHDSGQDGSGPMVLIQASRRGTGEPRQGRTYSPPAGRRQQPSGPVRSQRREDTAPRSGSKGLGCSPTSEAARIALFVQACPACLSEYGYPYSLLACFEKPLVCRPFVLYNARVISAGRAPCTVAASLLA